MISLNTYLYTRIYMYVLSLLLSDTTIGIRHITRLLRYEKLKLLDIRSNEVLKGQWDVENTKE